jgi:hypothetical protein
VLFSIAFSVWNVGTRPPERLVADIRSGLRDRAILRRGLFHFFTGAIAIVVGFVVLEPTAARFHNRTLIESLPIVTALIVEQLIGPDLRARSR